MNRFSFLNAVHSSYIGYLYEKYLVSPDSIEPQWRAFFQGFDFALETAAPLPAVPQEVSGYTKQEASEYIKKEFRVVDLINGYRTRGHLFTRTNPVRQRRQYKPTLAIENFGLEASDLDTVFNAGSLIGLGPSTLRVIIDTLERIYCESIGVEYMYIRIPEQQAWIQQYLNTNRNHTDFAPKAKKNILRKLQEAVSFEHFLHTKYVGQKRFSLEGGESLIPAIDTIIEEAADMDVKRFVIGMSHRGRLNVLVNIFGKSPKDIFSEFEGKDYDVTGFDGDVKYHLGWSSERVTGSDRRVQLDIAPNPSHLETVGAVVEGITRAKQEKHTDEDFSQTLPIIIHGDAAVAGQGVVYEIVQMANLDGYKTNGTIHIVVNNQVGFTTNYLDARSSVYCTDVAKTTLSPVLHVNADDAEAVVHACIFALKFRMAFKKDVFIDLLGYRKYGHNEGDEPRFTQPLLYKIIASHSNPAEIYAQKLLSENHITQEEVSKVDEDYRAFLERDLENSRKETKTVITPFMQEGWIGYAPADQKQMLEKIDTSYPAPKLKQLAETITTLPEDKKFINKIERLFRDRRAMVFDTNAIDWGMAEYLTYASLLQQGYGIRFSGQDVERGTFSHRHAVLKVEDSEEEYLPLNQVSATHKINIYNSLLSEYGVLGFDYGYAMARPDMLTVWEAQFGDFSNGAQIIIDQYISSAEDKWKIQNGIAVFLPHGFEGQGPEHSSARPERYLQLCAKDNMFVANCTTPANLFHLLRRQMLAKYRKPLILFTPKSLLRHPKAVSPLEDFEKECFQPLIDDAHVQSAEVKTVVFCTGKFYYDLLAHREASNRKDVALVRIEQLFPLPEKEINQTISKYANASDWVWAQEEPKNMGAWSHMMLHCESASKFRVASRRFYASPASGSATRDGNRQKEVIEYVFDKTKNNNLKR